MSNPGQIGYIAGLVVGVAAAIVFPPAAGLTVAYVAAFASVGAAVGGLAGQLYQTATAPDILREQQSLGDLKIQTSTQGKIIPQVLGEFGGISGNVIWATAKQEHQHRDEQSAGGKGGGPTQVTITKTYTVSMAIGVCDTRITGPVEIRQIYRDLKLVADMTGETDGGALIAVTLANPGSDYLAGQYVGVGGGNTNATVQITTVDEDGGVTGLTITTPGSGYSESPKLPDSITYDPDQASHLHKSVGAPGDDAAIFITEIVLGGLPENWAWYPGTAAQLPDPTIEADKGVGNVPAYRYLAYHAVRDEDLGPAGSTHTYLYTVKMLNSNTLTDIVVRLCAPCGLDGDTLDVASLQPADIPGTEQGVNMALVTRQQTRAVFEQLALAYRFYVVESGTKLFFRQINTMSAVFDIPEIDTSAAENHSDGTGVVIDRTDDIALPTELDFTYIDALQHYQANTQRATLGINAETFAAPQTLSVSMALASATAKQDALEILTQSWIQREGFQTTLGRKWAALEPGDRGILTSRGLQYAVILLEVTYGRPGLLSVKGVVDASYVRAAQGGLPAMANQPIQAPTILEASTATLLNLPALTTADQMPRYQSAYQGSPPWPGAVLLLSKDAEASYQQVDATFLLAITGTVALATASADYHVLDTTTTITVVMDYGEMTSIVDMTLFNGGNLCALGQEILGVGLCVLVATNTYELSRLLRGRRGTEYAVGTHGADERLTLLDAAVHKIPMALGDRGIERPYKVVTMGQNIAEVESMLFTPTARNLVPWSCANEYGSLNAGDWILEWRYRSPFTGEWLANNGQMGFDSLFNSFKVIIYSDNTFTTIKREIMVAGGGEANALFVYAYSSAMQAADFGGAQSILYWAVLIMGSYGDGLANHITST